MATPAPDALPDVPPQARAVVAGLVADSTSPVKLLVSGGIGTGKTAVLTRLRAVLRGAGIPVLTRAPRAGDPPDAAVVVDDVQLLDDDELGALARRVADSTSTLVVAMEPQVHRAALRALTTALERENPVVALGPMTRTEVNRAAAAVLGAAPSPELALSLSGATAGLPFLVRPALAAAGTGGGESPTIAIPNAAGIALIERLRRLDEPVLDTLLLSSLSPELGPDDVAATLRLNPDDALRLVDRARATGLIEPSHSQAFLQSVHRCVAQICGIARHHEIETSLLCIQIESSTLSADLALRMAEHGLRDARLATALTELAGRTRGRPARAARLYRAATAAGATALNTRLADALALTGDCATAGRIADELLASPDPAERAAAVRISASIAMHDGGAGQAAELFRWLGPYPDAAVAAAAATVAVATGDLPTARAAAVIENTGPPTSASRAARSLADGLLLSVDRPFPVAIARLGQSIGGESPSSAVTPDTSTALVTLSALHAGDTVRARSVIGRAVRADADEVSADRGDQFAACRHRLLLGWVRMQDGQLTAASGALPAAGADLHRRDALWAAALQTGIARRSGDSGAVQQHWYAAMEVLSEYSVDLFSLLPLGELWVAAARMRQIDRMRQPLMEAFSLLESLGNPALWAVSLHWAGVHAGILANSPDDVAPHGQALSIAGREGPSHSAFAKALANAGRTWLRVLGDQVETDEVTAASRALSHFGLTWDATRLASQAALHATDPRVSAGMLQLARDLKQVVGGQEDAPSDQVAPQAGPITSAQRPAASSRLSGREREVAELLLLGMPYRDIGAQLFISAKTVEHHVARIRRRLGAESRSEMLSMLRTLLATHG